MIFDYTYKMYLLLYNLKRKEVKSKNIIIETWFNPIKQRYEFSYIKEKRP